mgnify:CR=1 FL=1
MVKYGVLLPQAQGSSCRSPPFAQGHLPACGCDLILLLLTWKAVTQKEFESVIFPVESPFFPIPCWPWLGHLARTLYICDVPLRWA